MVRWCSIFSAKGHEDPHWWFHDHGNSRGLCPIQENKLNTNISTEAELVGLNDVLTQVIWTQYFLKEQGHMIHGNVIYQDN